MRGGKRLGDVIGRPGGKRVIYEALAGHCRDHDDGGATIDGQVAHMIAKLHPAHARHLNIHQKTIERLIGLSQFEQSFIARARDGHIGFAKCAEHRKQDTQKNRIIVYRKDLHLHTLSSNARSDCITFARHFSRAYLKS